MLRQRILGLLVTYRTVLAILQILNVE